MKIFVVHSVCRGKNDPSLVGIKIEKAFSRSSKAEEYAAAQSSDESIVNGELVQIRCGITELEVIED